jgi:hypothetical protein
MSALARRYANHLTIIRIWHKANSKQPINERIKELDFKDTKVRVTNVDSQGSDANIVIQVVGEISNQGQPHKRFVQTFVLAEQTNGYFVLNDIFRYLAEDPEEEEVQQEQTANGVEEPAPTAAVPAEEDAPQGEVASSEEDLTKVDEKLEEVAKEEPSTEEITATDSIEEATEAEKSPEVEETPAAEEAPKEAEAPAAPVEEEKPKDPSPTPAPAPKKEAAAPVAMPSGPPKPAAPRTWASLAASAHKVATPVVAAPAAQQVPKEAKAAAAAQPATAATPAQTSAPAHEQSPAASQGEAGWQSVSGHKKEQSRAQNQTPAADVEQKKAYIKNVYSQVQEGSLRAALSKFGEVEYLDLSRQKVSLHGITLSTCANTVSRTLLSLTSRPPPDTKPPLPPTPTPSTVSSSRSRSAASAPRVDSRVTSLVVEVLSAVAAVLVALAAASFLDVAAVVPLVAVVLLRSPERDSFCCLVSSPLHSRSLFVESLATFTVP